MKLFYELSCVLLLLINCSISDANNIYENDIFYDVTVNGEANNYFPENTKISLFYTDATKGLDCHPYEIIYKDNKWVPTENFILSNHKDRHFLTAIYPPTQKYEDNYILLELDGQIDYLVSKCSLYNYSPYANLNLEHILTSLSFIVYTNDNEDYNLTRIELLPNSSYYLPYITKAKFDLSSTTHFVAVETKVNLVLFSGNYQIPKVDNNEVICEYLVLPEIREQPVPIYLTINGKKHTILIDADWEAGHNYIYKINYGENADLLINREEIRKTDNSVFNVRNIFKF